MSLSTTTSFDDEENDHHSDHSDNMQDDDHHSDHEQQTSSSTLSTPKFYSDYFYLSSYQPYYHNQPQYQSSTNTNNTNNTTNNTNNSNNSNKLNMTVNKYLNQRYYMKSNQYHEQVFKNKYLNEIFKLTLEYSNKYKIKSCHHHDINGISINNNYLLSCGSDRNIGLYNYNKFLENDFDCIDITNYSNNNNNIKYLNRFNFINNNNINNNSNNSNNNINSNLNSTFKTEIKYKYLINKKTNPHKSIITNIKWYPYDNGMFFTSSYDEQLIIWDTQTMSSVMNFDCMSKINSFDIYSGNKIDTNQNVIACALEDNTIKLCDLNSGACVQQFIGHSKKVNSIQFSPLNEFLIASSSDDCTIRLWDIRTSGWLLSMDQFNIKNNNITKNRNNNLNNSSSNNSSSNNNINNVKNRIEKRKIQKVGFSTSKSYNYSNVKVPTAHNQSINSIKFSKCGQYLYSSSNDNKLMKWVVSNGKNTQYNCNIRNENKTSCHLIEETEGDILFHASFNKIELFDKFNGQFIKNLNEIHYDSIKCLALDEKNQLLFSAGNDHFIEVWDTNLNITYYDDQEDEYGNNRINKNRIMENLENIQDQDDWDD